MPKTNPACFGAMSSGDSEDPKLWKLLENMATVVKMMATAKEEVRPMERRDLVRVLRYLAELRPH